jgi:hypothetical protein
MDEKEIRKMTVVKLKEKLKDMGAETAGLKQVLVSRLLKEIEKKQIVNEDEEDDEVEDEKGEEENEVEDEEEDETNEDEEIIEVVKHPEKIVENVAEPLVKNSKRGKNLDFNFLIRYINAQEARESIDEDKCWKKGNKTESGNGTKQVYKCKFNKSSGCELNAIFCIMMMTTVSLITTVSLSTMSTLVRIHMESQVSIKMLLILFMLFFRSQNKLKLNLLTCFQKVIKMIFLLKYS